MSRYFWFILLISVAASAMGSPSVTKLSDWPTIVSIELHLLKDNGMKNEITFVFDNGKSTKSLKVKADYPSFNFELPNDPVVRMYYLKYIRRIERSGNLWKVTLTNGRSFKTWWLTTPVIYSHERNGVESYCYYSNADKGKTQTIAVSGLRSLQIKTSAKWVSRFSKDILIGCESVGLVIVHLRSGQSVSAKKVFLSDYCGRWGRTSTRTRWLNAKETYGGYLAATLDENATEPAKGTEVSGKAIDPLKVKRITLTGEFSKRWPACRQVVIDYRNGKQKKTNLLMTSESFNGQDEVTGYIGRDEDAIGGITEYGVWYVSLNNVKSIEYRH